MIDRAKILEELREIAKERSGHCLANEYINSTSKLLFKCKHGHQFESCRDYIKAGNWCPFCAGRGRTIADLQELAAQYGGCCLSPTFLGMGKNTFGSVQKVTNGKLSFKISRPLVDGVRIVDARKATELDDDTPLKICRI